MQRHTGKNYHNLLNALHGDIAEQRWHRWIITRSAYESLWGQSRSSLAVLALKCDRLDKENRQKPSTQAEELAEIAWLGDREGLNLTPVLRSAGGAA